MLANPKSFVNGQAVAIADISAVAPRAFRDLVASSCSHGGRLCGLVALPGRPGTLDLAALLAHDGEGRLSVLKTGVPAGGGYPSLTAAIPAAQALERAIWETDGLHPEGHPWLKPLRRHPALEAAGAVPDASLRTAPLVAAQGGHRSASSAMATEHPFFRVEGPGVHEVAVGPVHAGIIEPGHFRFQCSGETVHHLEIHLGYQHRGAEALLREASPARRLVVAESIAGDSVIAHGVAHCRALESLGGVEVPETALWMRAIALELERLANHVGDLGALCNDVGFLPGASWFGRLRGEFLNVSMEISGSRFGRGLLVLGGVRFGVSMDLRRDLLGRLAVARRDLEDVAALVFESPSVLSRFEHTGIVSRQAAEDLGLVGPAARASGCRRDVRCDHPLGAFVDADLAPVVETSGDVLARARVRWLEVRRSLEFVLNHLAALPDGPLAVPVPASRPGALVAVLVEGWRGEVLHVAATGDDGRMTTYRVFDPSLKNWFGLALALRGNPISDFPLCNKSFNLSYSGHDV